MTNLLKNAKGLTNSEKQEIILQLQKEAEEDRDEDSLSLPYSYRFFKEFCQ